MQKVGPYVLFVLFHPIQLLGGVAHKDAVGGIGECLLGKIDGFAFGDHVVQKGHLTVLGNGNVLAGNGRHAVSQKILAAALQHQVEGVVEIVVAFGVGKDVLVQADDELMAVATHTHVVVKGAGKEGVDLVVADGGAEFLGSIQGIAQPLGLRLHVAENAVGNAVDVPHGGVLHKALEHLHEFGVLRLQVEEVGAELIAALCNGLRKLRDRGVKKHLVEAVYFYRFDR